VVSLLSSGLTAAIWLRTLGQAFRFAGRLNRIHNLAYSTRALTAEEARELQLEEKTEAFSLTHALANEQ
jgi:hypothetical protein